METEEEASNGDNGIGSDRMLVSVEGDHGERIHRGNDVAEGGEVWCLKDEAVNNGVMIEDGVVQDLKKECVYNGVTIEGGNGVAEGEEVWGLKHGTVNNGVVIEGEEVLGLLYEAVNSGVTIGGNGVSDSENEEVRGLKNEIVNNGMKIDGGNGVVEGEEVLELKNETVNNGMEIEGGNGIAEGEEVQVLKKETLNNGMDIEGENGVAEGEEVCVLKNRVINSGVAITDGKGVAEDGVIWNLKTEAANIGVVIADVNCVAEGGQIWASKGEDVNNELVIADANGVAYSVEVQSSKNEAVNNEVVIADRNSVAYSREIQGSKNEAVNSEVVIADGNAVAYSGKVQGSKKEAVNNKLVIADENGIAEHEEDHSLKNGTVHNVVAVEDGFGVVGRDSSTLACLQTYKRRKYVKLSSESKVQENSREHMEAASHQSDKVVKKPFDLAVGNTSKDDSQDHWGNVVLKHLYHSLGNDNGRMEWCIREALMSCPKINCATTTMETFKIDKVGQECSSQLECLFYRLQCEASEHANVLDNGFSSKSNGCGTTERCQRMFRDILASEKFSSLCKVLLENFQGMKPESVFDFSVINSRIEGQAYEHSPALFLSDIQQVWRKLKNTGNQIVALAKSLSNMSKASFCEQLGISAQSSFEDEKQVESVSHVKAEQTIECVTFKVGTCKHCGEKASGTDCLICDSCEDMYHLSCIEPSVKEIPHKSWFCANCTASGIVCRHENCVVCVRLKVQKTLDGIVGEESIPTNEETLNEFEENSNCTYDGIHVSTGGINSSDCKICKTVVDGEKIKICDHPFCPSKHYHVRCLSSKQIKSYGLCWYCPSCICQICLTDKDDDKIVLCDGCDHAYHIYCMKPPRNSIPRGKWFCIKCEVGIEAIRQARKAYEGKKGKVAQNDSKPNEDIDKKWNKKRGRVSDKAGGMDMLITAVNTLNAEEDINAIQIDSKRTRT